MRSCGLTPAPQWWRAARRSSLNVIVAVAASLSLASRASALACGDTLGEGHFVLDTDLTCPSNSGFGVGLNLTSGAHLDMGGHSITFDIAGSGTGLKITGTGVHVTDGLIQGADTGVLIDGGGGHDLRRMRADGNNFGLRMNGSSDNRVSDSEFNGNAAIGIFLSGSQRNSFHKVVVDDTFGTPLAGGIFLSGSDENDITRSEIARSFCTGISLRDSSRNTVCHNAVQDSRCLFGQPAVDINLLGNSDGNVICKNQVSETAPGTADGINVGCKGGCAFQNETAGADGNMIVDNTADHEDRFGIAQAPGNTGNVYLRNEATGNGVADFAIDP